MPLLPKSLLLCCCFYLAILIFKNPLLAANIRHEDQNEPKVITTIDSYKNTTLQDTNQAMVPLNGFLSDFFNDFKYATNTNFTGRVLYTEPKAYLRLPAARAMQKALNILRTKGLTLKIFDAYRPYSVTVAMWQIVPDSRYAADPAKGSGHNRGAAVDVTLADILTGEELEMPTAFDDFSGKAHHDYAGASEKATKNRALLRQVMVQAGFVPLQTEWWHYSLPNAAQTFNLLDLDFKQLKVATGQ